MAQPGEWTILETYPIPEGASGLAFDGINLFCGIYGSNGDEIYIIDPSDGSFDLYLTGPQDDAYGLTWDGSNLWTTYHPGAYDPAIAVELDSTGTVISQFELPATYISGIAYDGGNFWVNQYYPDPSQIYLVNALGAVLTQFQAPDNQPWDICLQDSSLWIADYWGDALYKVDPVDGSLIESHDSEGVDPAGIVWDGQYLWYCDNGQGYDQDYLYKIDLGGTGTPVIELLHQELDFGNVIVGETDTLFQVMTNTGNGDLIITDLSFSEAEFSSSFAVPDTITTGDTVQIPVYVSPTEWYTLSAEFQINSNDPVTPVAPTVVEVFGIHYEYNLVIESCWQDFGTVRQGSLTSRTLLISNIGALPLELNSVELAQDGGQPGEFFIDDDLLTPLVLNTRDSLSFRLWFQSDEAGANEGALTFHGQQNTWTVFLDVEAIAFEEYIGTEFWSYLTNLDGEKVVAIRPFVDINDDGIDEVLVADNDYGLHCINGNSSGPADAFWIFSSDIPEIGTGSVYHERGLAVADDLNGDGIQDVILGTAWGSRAVFALDGSNAEILWIYDTHVIGGGGWIYEVDAKRDFNSDGISDVLACSGDDGGGTGPKRVYLFDGTNGNTIWEYPFGHAVTAVKGMDDVTGDAIPDVICGTSPELSDARVYLLDGADGSIEWSYDTDASAVFAVTAIPDADSDGLPDIVAGDFSSVLHGLSSTGTVFNTIDLGGGLITNLELGSYLLNSWLIPTVTGSGSFDLVRSGLDIVEWTISPGGNVLDASYSPSIDGYWYDLDVLIGTLDGIFAVYDDDNGELEYSQTFAASAVDQTASMNDIDGNNTRELLVGLRNGWVHCMSGGPMVVSDMEDPTAKLPREYILKQNHPNPFNPSTTLRFGLPDDSRVKLDIYDIRGHHVTTILNGWMSAGWHEFEWNAEDDLGLSLSTGVYLCHMRVAGFSRSIKLVYMK